MAAAGTGVPVLESFIAGKKIAGTGSGSTLGNPSTGEPVARCSSQGLDLAAALEYSRRLGGPALKALPFADRAELLWNIADALFKGRKLWMEIAQTNAGNTKADASMDIDGSIATLRYYSKEAGRLGSATLLTDGPAVRVSRDPKFQAIHIGTPIPGVAVHINAFNFPAWALWEKVAVSLLSGVPAFVKPATSTAWLAQAMAQRVIEANVLPEGALSWMCGPAGDLLDHLRFGDAIVFTGSADTADLIRQHNCVRERGVRLNVEADSLNAAVLGPDAEPGSPAFALFVREVVREMTIKAGQKCTAIRRVLVPAAQEAAVADAIAGELAKVIVGNPANATVTMGPLATMAQRRTIEEGIRKLSEATTVHYQASPLQVVDADTDAGAFVGPTLLRANADVQFVHDLEVFGPVATVIPYADADQAFALAHKGCGSLAASVFSADTHFLANAAACMGSSHGRLLLVDPSIGDSHMGHGVVMPSCIHGGPGRAGGGEEMGGLRALWFYHQRTAIQASEETLAALQSKLVNPATAQ
ncbi:MAG: 3,4-dehydroadipyl-CoA semialdehyde dehydrogenase [Bryobacteraceae bacterium]